MKISISLTLVLRFLHFLLSLSNGDKDGRSSAKSNNFSRCKYVCVVKLADALKYHAYGNTEINVGSQPKHITK